MNESSKKFPLMLVATVGFGVAIATFDLLRKTVLLGASWNYDYPHWHLIYDLRVMIILVVVMGGIALALDRIETASTREFLSLLVAATILLSVLSFYLTPVKSYQWALTPHTPGPVESFLYHPATVLVEDGVMTYLSSFHSLETLSGTGRVGTAQRLSTLLQSAEFLPYHDSMAKYAADIKTQRHGPIPPMLVAPFLFVFGTSVENAVIASYAITVTLPLVSYFTFREYFSDSMSRIGSLLILYAPAYLLYQRYSTIAYDAITAVLVTLSLYFFLRGVNRGSTLSIAAAGLVFSLAALSKISVLVLIPSYLLILVILSINTRITAERIGAFAVSAGIVPTLFLLAGYNFLVQYLFDFARLAASPIGSGSVEEAGGASSLFDQLFAWALTVYNTRLLGPALIVFAVVFVLKGISDREVILGNERRIIATAFIPSLLPFMLLKGMTTSRHLLTLVAALGIIGLCGMEIQPRERRTRLIQASLLVTAGVAIVNL